MPESLEDLQKGLVWAQEQGVPVTFISGGTNILISDRGVRGLVISLRKMTGIEEEERGGRLLLNVWAGTSKSELLKSFLKRRVAPALFLAGLPGDVGGGVVMNAGVSESIVPREFCEIVDWIEVISFGHSGEPYQLGKGILISSHVDVQNAVRLNRDQLQWSYRRCGGWRPGVIVRVGCSWPLEADASILEKVKVANQRRLSLQPLEFPNCGSVFKNPSDRQRAGMLIDQCGLKGLRWGDAQISEKHANFIVNLGQAKAMDIYGLMEHARKRVKEKFGLELESEIVRVGDWDEIHEAR